VSANRLAATLLAENNAIFAELPVIAMLSYEVFRQPYFLSSITLLALMMVATA
jgi:hypothetical protein